MALCPARWLTGLEASHPAVAQASVQRQLGLHLSASKPALLELAELGETVDFFGDKACNTANPNRRHSGALRGWHDVIAAVATTQTVLGDKTTVYGDTMYSGTDAFVSPYMYMYCLKVRSTAAIDNTIRAFLIPR